MMTMWSIASHGFKPDDIALAH